MVKYFIGLVFMVSIVMTTNCAAEDYFKWRPYTKADYAREAAFGVLLYADYKQTTQIGRHCTESSCITYEKNPLLQGVSKTHARNYFLVSLIGHAIITGFLPYEDRKMWQWAGIALQTMVVLENRQIGLKFRF